MFAICTGVSAEKEWDMNSLTVPRFAKEAIGAICRLEGSNGKAMTVNVEYNQLDALLRDSSYPDGAHIAHVSNVEMDGVDLNAGIVVAVMSSSVVTFMHRKLLFCRGCQWAQRRLAVPGEHKPDRAQNELVRISA
jgi:hypothetical protein